MTITANQLRQAVINAGTLGNNRDASAIRDMAQSLKRWGKFTPRQEEFAKALIERNSAEKCSIQENKSKEHQTKWVEDQDYQGFIIFLARFFSVSIQQAYFHHINNRSHQANKVLDTLERETPSWSDCNSLLTSKLVPRLRQTYDATPLYALGELVQVRKSETDGWEYSNGLVEEMGFIIEINSAPVNTVATYHKTKGGTRVYDIMFPSGRRTKRENQLKLVSRKNHNKGKSCK